MNKQEKLHTKIATIALLAASAINRVAVSRESGIVAVAAARIEGDNPSRFMVSAALVGAGDSFKLWEGMNLALLRAETEQGNVYRADTIDAEDALRGYIVDNGGGSSSVEVYDADNIEQIGKMQKALDAWVNMPAVADKVLPAEWPFPSGPRP